MRLSQTNGALFGYYDSIDGTLCHLRKCGFTSFDVSFFTRFYKGSTYFGDEYRKIADEYHRAMDKYGMTLVQSHEPAGNCIGDDGGEYYMKKTPRAIELASLIGCPSITVHPGIPGGARLSRDEFYIRNIAALKKLIPYAEKYNIKILVENVGNKSENYYAFNADDLLAIIDGVNHPLFGVCWDVGHANLAGCDQQAEIRKLSQVLWGLHVHDNLGYAEFERIHINHCDMHTLPGYGNIDFDRIIKTLIEVGYSGTFNFEVDAPHARNSFFGTPAASPLDTFTKELRLMSDTLLYNIGKRMLDDNGIFEA